MNRKFTAVLAVAGVLTAGGAIGACSSSSGGGTPVTSSTTAAGVVKADGYTVVKTESGASVGAGLYITQVAAGTKGTQGEIVISFTNRAKPYESIVAAQLKKRFTTGGPVTITYRDHGRYMVFDGSVAAFKGFR